MRVVWTIWARGWRNCRPGAPESSADSESHLSYAKSRSAIALASNKLSEYSKTKPDLSTITDEGLGGVALYQMLAKGDRNHGLRCPSGERGGFDDSSFLTDSYLRPSLSAPRT